MIDQTTVVQQHDYFSCVECLYNVSHMHRDLPVADKSSPNFYGLDWNRKFGG